VGAFLTGAFPGGSVPFVLGLRIRLDSEPVPYRWAEHVLKKIPYHRAEHVLKEEKKM
jgi:hypothetical protein